MSHAPTPRHELETRSRDSSPHSNSSEPFVRLPAVDLVQEMVHQLRSHIIAGRYGIDGELPAEAQLSESFGVSRTVARESMRTLRTLGLVEVSRGRRPRVRPVDPQFATDSLHSLLVRSGATIPQLVEIRRPLEVDIAGLAAERATSDQIEMMQKANEQLASARSLERKIEADTRFHEVLAIASGNPLFSVLLSSIAPLLDKSRTVTILRVGVGRAIEGHAAILDAVRAHDSQAARAAMRRHLDMAAEDLGLEETTP